MEKDRRKKEDENCLCLSEFLMNPRGMNEREKKRKRKKEKKRKERVKKNLISQKIPVIRV